MEQYAMDMPELSLPLTTERLLLRPFAEGDFESYAAYHSLPELYRYLYSAVPTRKALEEKFKGMLEAPFKNDGDVFRLAVVTREDETLAGQVTLKLASKAARQGEVGYIFNPAFAGKGYATEAVAKIINVGFSAFRFHRIFARLDAANKGSIGVVERLRLRREAHLRQNDQFDGVWGDEYIYAVLASEWREPTDQTAEP
ncbi:GNAT family N-acetyltransferase [Mesorhizobium sp. B2-3-5]|uniref:GNAT family N-acetyltransferase n=1 Tax=Mesorhizobium sp. B2-3-5 TaxID=2589958 RepID=UPI001FEF8E61|nr:GNAT family N-acetyltransferase [Mesorhizobium sp. B2-3-5]